VVDLYEGSPYGWPAWGCVTPDQSSVKFVAVCTRVAWFSHKSGGLNAHLLPEVLVNTDTHLDLFDSESEDA